MYIIAFNDNIIVVDKIIAFELFLYIYISLGYCKVCFVADKDPDPNVLLHCNSTYDLFCMVFSTHAIYEFYSQAPLLFILDILDT